MSEASKQEVLLNDLSIIQSQVEILANRCRELTENNLELEGKINELKKDKILLTEKISKLEAELKYLKEKSGNGLFSSLEDKDKEELKKNIKEIIKKIDCHLSAEYAG